MYLSITGATPDNKLAKFQPFNTEAEAQEHAVEYNGFAIQDPEGNQSFWIVDMDAKTVTIDTVSEEAETALRNNTQYARDRKYPSLGDQLDMIFHAGLGGDTFQTAIQAVKDAHPKPV
jgi:predicted phosphoribosyltransferase